MKKLVTIIVFVAIALAIMLDIYWLFFPKRTTEKIETATSNLTSQSSSSSASSPSSSAVKTANKQYKDGTFTGSEISTQWGNVQVQVTISGGKITKAKAIEYPNDNERSSQINQIALPSYNKETVSAQSANIQAMSGATETYDGYTKSVQSALDKAV